MTEITVAGETFNVRFEGDESKEVLALAHHLGGSLAFWDPLMPALLEHFRILRWDARGHGASVANEGPYSIAGLARDAIAIFDALGVETAHWLGLSMGAITGQAAMIAQPARIGRAVLANTAAQLAPPDIWNARIEMARVQGMEAMADAVAARWFTAAFRQAEPEAVEAALAIVRANPAGGYAAACAALRDMDQREAIRAVRNAVLVIAGRHDASAPPGLGATVASAIEGARFITLEAAHISPIEDREAFTRAAIDFMTTAEIPARQAPAPRQAPARTAAARKAGARKAGARSTPARTPLSSRTPAKRAPAPKAPAKKAAAKTAAVARAPTKKAPVKKAAARKAAVRTAGVKKAAVKTSGVKKAAPKKGPTKKASVKSTKASPKSAPAKSAAVRPHRRSIGRKTGAKTRPGGKTAPRR